MKKKLHFHQCSLVTEFVLKSLTKMKNHYKNIDPRQRNPENNNQTKILCRNYFNFTIILGFSGMDQYFYKIILSYSTL